MADIVETAARAGSFTTLVAAVRAAGLTDTLEGPGPFTVFAPTDAAFAHLPPGALEAHWKFDEDDGRAARDSSGHDLVGEFHTEPPRTAGMTGCAPVFDGENYVHVARSSALRTSLSALARGYVPTVACPVRCARIIT